MCMLSEFIFEVKLLWNWNCEQDETYVARRTKVVAIIAKFVELPEHILIGVATFPAVFSRIKLEVNPSSNQIRTACVCQHSSLGSGETIQRHYRDWFTPTVRTGRIGLIWKQQRKASVVGYSSLLAVFVLGCFFIRSLAFQPQFDYIELFNILEKTFLFTTFINLCQEIQYSIFVLIVFNTFENLVTIHATCERGITTLLGITGRECLGMDSCLE
ncbi:hypothetical protein KSF78_0006488 [Schistosoma japonicum]|nr:hypothetical protein KSF78_0006488 [Schistosoma japonicum]